jgi:hypothetical protein
MTFTLFANLTQATGQELDGNFAALGASVVVPCTLTGTNIVTLTPPTSLPAIMAYANYTTFSAVATAYNTSAQTMQVGTLPGVNVYKDTAAGPALLTGYEIAPNNLVVYTYDSALNSGAGGWHLTVSASNSVQPQTGVARTLSGVAPGSAKTATWVVPELTASATLGGLSVKGASQSLSFNGATTGAGGMDTGATPTSGALAVYAIYNPSTATWSTLGYASASVAPAAVYHGTHMPAGYVFSVLLWTGLTDGSGNVLPFQQFDRTVFVGPTQVFTGTAGTANTYATLAISSAVPYGALTVFGTAGSTSTAAAAQVAIASTTAGLYAQHVVSGQSGTALDSWGSAGTFNAVPLTTAQQVAWKAGTNTVNTTISITGYTF